MNMKPICEYPFWHLAAAEALTSVYYVTAEQAKRAAAENKKQYQEDLHEGWVEGKTFAQYQREYGAPWREGWWWYVELNEEDAPVGGPYKSLEQAARAGMRKHGRGDGAVREVTYSLLFEYHYLCDIVNLGTDCHAPVSGAQVNKRTAKALQARWFKLVAAGNWQELERQWGFKPDKAIAEQVAAVIAGRKVLSKLRAEQAAREAKITNAQLKAALKKVGFKYRKHGDGWQWWWAESQWRDYVPGITERAVLLLEAEDEKLLGLQSDWHLKVAACEQTGAHYGNLD